MTGYLSREITPRLERALRQLPAVVLSGLRQTGKSTLLQNEAGLARGHISGANAGVRRRRAGLQREGSGETGRATVGHSNRPLDSMSVLRME